MKNHLIDKLKIQVLLNLESKEVTEVTFINNLFKLLKIDMNKYVSRKPFNNCKSARTYDEHVYVCYDPFDDAIKLGSVSYFIVEMEGQACRDFELRGGSWEALIDFLAENVGGLIHIKAIDLAKDDIDGVLPFDEIKNKLRHQHFTSIFRSTKKAVPAEYKKPCFLFDNSDIDVNELEKIEVSDIINEDWINSVSVLDKTGFTCDFGYKGNFQLEIYDKKVERIVRGAPTGYASWIRFELRYGGSKADNALILVNDAIKKGTFSTLISSLLAGALTFREIDPYDFDKNHYYRAPICKWWQEFIGDVAPNKVKSIATYQPTMERSIRWYKEATSRMSMKLIDAGIFDEIFKQGIASKLEMGKYDNRSRSEVTNYLLSFGKTPSSNHEQFIAQMYDLVKDYFSRELSLEEILERNLEKPKKGYEEIDSVEKEYTAPIINAESGEIEIRSALFNQIYENELRELTFEGDCDFEIKDYIRVYELGDDGKRYKYWNCRITDIFIDDDSYTLVFEVWELDGNGR